MKKQFIIILFLIIFSPSSVFAYDPLRIELQPTQQYKNEQTEQGLINQYGSSAFYECYDCLYSDTSDPYAKSRCLLSTKYCLERQQSFGNLLNPPTYNLENNEVVQKTPDEICKQDFGQYSYYTNQKNIFGDYICSCINDYQWNTDNTTCVKKIEEISKTPDEICKQDFGQYSYYINQKNEKGNYICSCINDYQWNTDNTTCVKKIKKTYNSTLGNLLIANRPTYYYIYDYSDGIKGNLLKEIKFISSKTQDILVLSNNVLIEWNNVENKDFITRQSVYFNLGQPWARCGGDIQTACVDEQYNDVKENQIIMTNLQLNKKYSLQYRYYYTYGNHLDQLGGFFNPFFLTAIKKNEYNNSLINGLKGKILLQVEKNGEGWYVSPDDNKKYYLGRPADAFSIMRNLGLGIKHSELLIYLDTKFPSRLSGKILLDVEADGEAYYVNPDDLKGYFLNRPSDAFEVMKKFGLGITNIDIEKINTGKNS